MRKIEQDKWRHFYVGLGMGVGFQIAALLLLPQNVWLGASIVFFVITAISYGFELFSLVTGWGHHDIVDAIAGVIGGVAGMLIVFLASIFI